MQPNIFVTWSLRNFSFYDVISPQKVGRSVLLNYKKITVVPSYLVFMLENQSKILLRLAIEAIKKTNSKNYSTSLLLKLRIKF